MKREVIFTIEEIVEVYEPHSPFADRRGMVDYPKTTKGFAIFNDESEIEDILIENVVVGVLKTDGVRAGKSNDKTIIKKLFEGIKSSLQGG